MQVQPSTPLPGRIKESPNPKSHPPSSNTRICACKPSASVSPGPERHTLAQHQTDARGAHPDHPSCSTTVTVPGRSSRLQATRARARPGEYVRHLVLLTRRSRCWSCCQLPGLPMARAGRLVTRSRPCGCDSTLCDQSIHCVQSSRGTCSLHMGSCESVVGAIAEAETAA